MAFHYRVYGEQITSEIELDVLEPCEPAAGGWSFRVSAEGVGDNVDWYHTIVSADDDGRVRYGSAGESHFVEVSGLPTIRISTEEREIVAFAPGPVSRDTLTHVVVDQALPLCIAHSRRLVLHASCVARDDVAIAFAGPSGSGKSTLAAAFCRQGWQLVSDDALAFASVSPPRVDVAYHSVRLWRESLRWLGAHDLGLPRVAEGVDKRLLEMPRSNGTRSLRRIFLMTPGRERFAPQASQPEPERDDDPYRRQQLPSRYP